MTGWPAKCVASGNADARSIGLDWCHTHDARWVLDNARCDVAAVDSDSEMRRQEILNLPEWYQPMSNSSGSCPWCESMQHWGHAEGCARATVLEILEAALGSPHA